MIEPIDEHLLARFDNGKVSNDRIIVMLINKVRELITEMNKANMDLDWLKEEIRRGGND